MASPEAKYAERIHRRYRSPYVHKGFHSEPGQVHQKTLIGW